MRRIFPVLVIVAFLCGHSYAANSFDSSGTPVSVQCATNTPCTFNYTVGAGCTNPYLIVGTWFANTPTGLAVTYNSVSMTESDFTTWFFAAGRISIWTLANPPTGAADTVSISISSAAQIVRAAAASYCGATSIDTHGHNSGSGTTASGTLCASGCNTGDWIILYGGVGNGNTLTASTNSTARTGVVQQGIFDSNGSVSGSTTLSQTNSANASWGTAFISLKPSGGGVTCTPSLASLGVGSC